MLETLRGLFELLRSMSVVLQSTLKGVRNKIEALQTIL